MNNGLLLWVDDEIELLKAHILFLEKKGYEVETVSNGQDALDKCSETTYDLILLDENMPGLSGLETLSRIKEITPVTPVVMVTKSEEENIMDQAIGSKIADYLIKPVNPTQILLTLKKNIHKKEIVTEVAQNAYQQNFGKIGMQINDSLTFEDWKEVYKRLVYWELELSETDSNMDEMLGMQKTEANLAFAKFIRKHYEDWIAHPEDRPLMSPDIFKTKIFPLLNQGEKVFLIVLDNFRYDQWRTLSTELADAFLIDEDIYCSILPTATQYARNAIFSGLMPDKIAQMYPDLWVDEDEEEGKNLNEGPLIQTQLDRYRRKNTFSYHKINDSTTADKLIGRSRIIDFMVTECILTAVTVQLGLDERPFVQVLALFFVFVHPKIRVHLGDFVRHQTGKDGVARILCGRGQDAAINIFVDEERIRQFRTECPPLVVTEIVQNDEKHLFPLIQQGEYFGFEDIRTH